MKFRHKNPPYLNILVIILAAIQIVMITLNICKFAGLFGLYSLMTAMEIAQTVLALIILAVCGCLAFMNYKIEQGKVKIMFAFFDLTGGKFFVSRIRAAIRHTDDNGLYLSVYTDDVEPTIMKINIAPKSYDEFVEALQKVNPGIYLTAD